MHKRITEEVACITDEWARRDNLAEIYARYDNRLRVVVDGDCDEEYDFLCAIDRYLTSLVVRHYMKENGYVTNWDDDYHRWHKVY